MLWLALFVACEPEPEDADAEPSCSVLHDWELDASGPFAIEATAEGRTITASLRNVSPWVKNALHHPVAQPSGIVLVSRDEAVIEPTDERTVEDTALVVLPRAAWLSLDPCEELWLGQATFTWGAGSWDLAWGPFRWTGLDAGRYTAIVTLPMVLEHYNDPLGSRRGIDDVWTGEVRSEPVEIVLPGVSTAKAGR
jgi:hypothetical protein